MHIKEMLSQNRRDFRAVYECEHCGSTEEKSGYDDSYFHDEVIPNMPCVKCGKKAGDGYKPASPMYPEGMIV